jgi:hypothetical protein
LCPGTLSLSYKKSDGKSAKPGWNSTHYEFTLPEGEHEVLGPVKQREVKISGNADIPNPKKTRFRYIRCHTFVKPAGE